MTDICSQLTAMTSALLTLERHIVGITFLSTQEEYKKRPAAPMRAKIAYCVAVKAAMAGKSIKLEAAFSGCNGGSRVLGFSPPSEPFRSGHLYQGFGLYQDLSVSKQVADTMTACDRPSFGILAQPLEHYTDDVPDVVILAVDARNAMRLVQGYTYSHGSQPLFKLTGNQAICSECTAYPLKMERMNLSMLCSGTRYLARWKDHELAIGLPFSQFAATVDGLLRTADAVELDAAKHSIREKLLSQGLPDPNFRFGYTYYRALEQEKARQRRQSP
jgi:uncharacterized protein (DUF169 family)